MPEPATGVALNTVEVRFTGGMLALNRLLMTLQNKRMPVAGFTLGHDAEGMRATILLDCPPESALRYTAIISALEDVTEAGPAQTIEVALVETRGGLADGRREGRGRSTRKRGNGRGDGRTGEGRRLSRGPR